MSPAAILSVARKECLHIVRDWRILLVLLLLPPAFTLMFGYAFEVGPKSAVLRGMGNFSKASRDTPEMA